MTAIGRVFAIFYSILYTKLQSIIEKGCLSCKCIHYLILWVYTQLFSTFSQYGQPCVNDGIQPLGTQSVFQIQASVPCVEFFTVLHDLTAYHSYILFFTVLFRVFPTLSKSFPCMLQELKKMET